MNRNHKLLYALVITLIAALTGCGGGDPKTMSTVPVDPTQDADVPDQACPDTGNPDSTCAMSLGSTCAPNGITDPCTGFECICGKWMDTNSPISTAPCVQEDAGTDSPEDVVEPDVDLPDVVTPDEICGNGLDDDGNGKADCQDQTCSAETECQVESCNGLDDNGNGQTDEGFECEFGATAQCQSSCGSIGTMNCNSGCTWGACTPPAEVCGNGLDDNCNGVADCDDTACLSYSACQCDSPVVGSTCGLAGEFSCDPTVRCDCAFTWTLASSGNFSCIVTEVCNGLDDNGNSLVDEGFPCVKGTSQNCSTSCGSTGYQTCGATCEFGSCAPPLESCGNGVDDDCDGKADCADSDCSGLLACQTEICDGADNNGNGLTDEGYACIAGSTGSCSTSCGSAGMYQCSSTCTKGACIAFENCYAQGDEDCDGKADCADTDCVNLPLCNVATEVCNGLDDNNNGQIDETFQCPKGSAPVSCITSCGSAGTKACLSNCSFGSCAPPSENCTNGVDDDCDGKADCNDPDCSSLPACQTTLIENCTNGVDDDNDGKADCLDTDCVAELACHNFGTCPSQSPSGVGYTCGTWTQDTVPSTIYQITGGCANSVTDQWAVGGDWGDVKALHLTGNQIWSEVSLPVPGKTNKGSESVVCLGQNQVYMTYNDNSGGIFLRWNGSTFTRLMQNELSGMNVMALWGFSENNLWLVARNDQILTQVKVFHWNGNTATSADVNPNQPNSWLPMAMWGTSSSDVYVAGNTFTLSNPTDYTTHKGVVMHWDGNSWASVPGADTFQEFYAIHGSSSCDVMAVGGTRVGADFIGATFERDGNQWTTKNYTALSVVAAVVKIAPAKYVLQGQEEIGVVGRVWMGTPKSDSTILWSSVSEDFYYPGTNWAIPNTSPQVIITAGDGNNGPEIRRSSCQ